MQVYKPATPENHRADVIFLRDYSEGVMQKETVLRVADKDAQRKALKAVAKEQKRTDRKASQKVSWLQVSRAGRCSQFEAFHLVLVLSEQTGSRHQR